MMGGMVDSYKGVGGGGGEVVDSYKGVGGGTGGGYYLIVCFFYLWFCLWFCHVLSHF